VNSSQIVVARTAARHSLFWLVAANAVGVWLAAVLVWPSLGDLISPLTYGRWMPLHLDWQLYGWCSLPLVAVLLRWCLDERHPHVRGHARAALAAWSGALRWAAPAGWLVARAESFSSTGKVRRGACCPPR
jgi:cytochrome c oxidase cbb3-type subunit 1